ncbi:uncharacterized protein LOC128389456 [Panonychus citri]|uniref:uncharacterized protein LOC128389456 n=1 Tax=Panonychus citri TaxID=50023 RepID=UPI0023079D72|nr:uncharacterized protein LOC128389456 [Panonychus citri]
MLVYIRKRGIVNLILIISLLIQCLCQPAIKSNKTKRRGNKRKSNEKVTISSTFELNMKKASLTDFIHFANDIISGAIVPETSDVNGKTYDLNWSSDQIGTSMKKSDGQEISLNLVVLDKYASLIRSFGGPKHKFPVKSQVLKSTRHTQRPVLQTIIDFIEEQTTQHYSRDIGQFMVNQAAKFTELYVSSSAKMLSSGLLTIASWLEKKESKETKESKIKFKPSKRPKQLI